MIQTLSSSNFIYRVRYFIYIWLVFYTKLTHLVQKIKKLKLDITHGAKLNSN